MGWALAEAPLLCPREVGCSRSPQRGRTHHFQGLSRPFQERIQWVGPGEGHSTARSDGWGRSARTWVWPGDPRSPGASAGGTAVLSREKRGSGGYRGESPCLGLRSEPPRVWGSPRRDPPGFQLQPRPSLQSRREAGSRRKAHPPTRPGRGAGPRWPRPGPIGCRTRGGARLPDVGAAAAAGAAAS